MMPIILNDGGRWEYDIPFSMFKFYLAKNQNGIELKQLAYNGGVTPSQAVAMISDSWLPVSDDTGLAILRHILDGKGLLNK